MSTPAELLDAYHRQVRGVLPSTQPEGVVVDRDGPLQRVSGGKHSGYVEYRDLAGLSGPALDELIERTCAYFGGRRERFEWKTHSYDEPADLPSRLIAAGFVPGEVETVVVGLAEQLTAEPRLPDGVGIRRVSEAADFDRIGRCTPRSGARTGGGWPPTSPGARRTRPRASRSSPPRPVRT